MPDLTTRYRLRLFQQPVSAGFPSPAEDHIDGKLDLDQHFIKNPVATFYVRVSGDSMTGAGIHNGDLLIVDRSLEPTPGRVVIAVINGEHTVKRLHREGDRLLLLAENANYLPIVFTELDELHIWGVVTFVLHTPELYADCPSRLHQHLRELQGRISAQAQRPCPGSAF